MGACSTRRGNGACEAASCCSGSLVATASVRHPNSALFQMLLPLSKADAQALQPVFDACVDYAMLQDGQPFQPDAAEREFEAIPPGFPSAGKHVFGLKDSSGSLVGLLEGLAGYPSDDIWFIGLLLVVPRARGRGVGTLAFDALQQRIGAEGRYSTIRLAVLEENQAALAFWRRLGFSFLEKSPTAQFGVKFHGRHVLQRALRDDSQVARST